MGMGLPPPALTLLLPMAAKSLLFFPLFFPSFLPLGSHLGGSALFNQEQNHVGSPIYEEMVAEVSSTAVKPFVSINWEK